MAFFYQKTILIAPLDWGLGHATRCIPIIKELQSVNCKVIIAGEKATLKILSEAFPALQTIHLRGYRVHYSPKKSLFALYLLIQSPKILLAIYKEHQWLKKVVKKYTVDAVISDNRFGLYHTSLPCVYITHQLNIKTGNRFLNKLVQKLHFSTIKKFTHCWVPDFENANNSMAGILSHADNAPFNVSYIGGLSRFKGNSITTDKLYSIVAVLSGPEPQRTIFENILLVQLQQFKTKSLLVRGLPNEINILAPLGKGNLEIKNHLNMHDLNEAMLQAEWVIARSGYTTVMDLVKIQQRAILIPTPGQTEQEYLADYLTQKKFFFTASQQQFDLAAAVKEALIFPSGIVTVNMDLYKQVLADFVHLL